MPYPEHSTMHARRSLLQARNTTRETDGRGPRPGKSGHSWQKGPPLTGESRGRGLAWELLSVPIGKKCLLHLFLLQEVISCAQLS